MRPMLKTTIPWPAFLGAACMVLASPSTSHYQSLTERHNFLCLSISATTSYGVCTLTSIGTVNESATPRQRDGQFLGTSNRVDWEINLTRLRVFKTAWDGQARKHP